MTAIVSIVEGHGEVRALPILLRRLVLARGAYDLDIPEPIRVQKDRFLNQEQEFERMMALAAAKAGKGGNILIVMDADDDCPVILAADVGRRAANQAKEQRIGVVIANREYEAWFLAGAASLAGKRQLTAHLQPPSSPDAIRDAKGWLSQHMTEGRYHEVLDQPAFSAVFDIAAATQRSRSLRKLVETVDRLLDGHSSRPF